MRKDAKVLMADGSVKTADAIRVDELVMGDDRKPRKVITLVRGPEVFYRLMPTVGGDVELVESMTVTVITKEGKVKDIAVSTLWRMGAEKREGLRLMKNENVKGRLGVAYLPFSMKTLGKGWKTAFRVDGNGRFILADGTIVRG